MSLADPDLDADAIEELYARGVTDGLPVVPPTRARVDRVLAASGRAPDALIAMVPPNYGRATVEKIAVNAVMAGCRPEYLPVVIAAVEAVCDEAFDLHGVSATTNAPAPLVVVNGPIRGAPDINSGAGVFGPGWRANATIGRALRLVCVNLGGAAPGVISMSTLAHPGRYTYCIGEREEASPWESLSVEHGFAPSDSTVAVLAADGPLGAQHQERGRRWNGRPLLGDRARLDVREELGSRVPAGSHPVIGRKPHERVSGPDRLGRRAAEDRSPAVEPRRQDRHAPRHLEGEGRPPPRPHRRAPPRARAPEGDREEEEADLRPPGARPAPPGDRRRDGRPRRGARRLRVVHHVQCARRRVLRGPRHPDGDRDLVRVRPGSPRPGRRARRDGLPNGRRPPSDPDPHA